MIMDNQTLGLHLTWLDDEAISLAKLSVSIEGKPIWPVISDEDAGLEVFSDDILAFLAENWHSLLLGQSYPIYAPSRPSRLRLMASAAWELDEGADAENEDLQIEAFEQTHNLASCFAGMMDLPALWLMRDGNSMIVDNGRDIWKPYLNQATLALETLGDTIAHRLSSENKFASLLEAWNSRTDKDPLTLLSTAAGIPRHYAQDLVTSQILIEPRSFAEAANDDDELRIAARVTGTLSLEQVRAILSFAKRIPLGESASIRRVKDGVSTDLAPSTHRRAHDVGASVAMSVRESLGLSSAQRIDLQKLLTNLCVSLEFVDSLADGFKGLAIWGTLHGPGIILATRGQGNPFTNAYQRVTIAHELGHLLMDGSHAIGAVDVLHGRVPLVMEQRAQSFAGEFLLPAKSAAAVWQQRNHPNDRNNLTDLIEALRKKYGVTRAVAAWKLEHGLKTLGVDLSDTLNKIVPER
jgi:hypothetical protein